MEKKSAASRLGFNETEMQECFEELSDLFYDANFGQASKKTIELTMFKFYMEKLIKDHVDEDGVLDYNECSDYKMAKVLGITPQKVSNLKVENHMVNEVKYDWKKSFAKLIYNARLENKKVIISIPDPNLYLDIQNFLEEQGGYIEKTLNKKLLTMRIEYFIQLIYLAEEDPNEQMKIKKELIRVFKESEKKDNELEPHKIATFIKKNEDLMSVVPQALKTVINPQAAIPVAISDFIKKVYT